MKRDIGSAKNPALIVAVFLVGVLLLALPFVELDDTPVLLLWLGRFHPLVLHFPIAFLVVLLFLEGAKKIGLISESRNVILMILLAASATTLAAIGAGYFLYASGEYSGELMDSHFWGAVVTGCFVFACLGIFLLAEKNARLHRYYLISLICGNVAVAFTSHMGGSITHGADYLTEYLPVKFSASEGEAKPREEMTVYADMIAPIFQAKCLSCHNDTRAKGGLSMTSLQNMTKGGDSGNASIVKGDTSESEIFKRITLPAGHDDKMPPEGKTPLTEDEVRLLKYWIESEANEDLLLTDAGKELDTKELIERILPGLVAYRRREEISRLKLEKLSGELTGLAQQLDVEILPDEDEEGLFAMRMKFPPASFTNEQFKLLRPYYDVFSKLTLVSSGIDDDGLYHIGQMTNIKQLYLQKTSINGTGLIYLRKLPDLEVLNLSFTEVDDKSLIDLLDFPSLKVVYLLGTKTSLPVIEAIQKNKPGLRLIPEEGPYF